MTVNNPLTADRKATTDRGELLTVTATAYEGQARITGQINGKTIREEKLFGVNDISRLDTSADAMLNLLKRSCGVAVVVSDLPRCEVTGRVL